MAAGCHHLSGRGCPAAHRSEACDSGRTGTGSLRWCLRVPHRVVNDGHARPAKEPGKPWNRASIRPSPQVRTTQELILKTARWRHLEGLDPSPSGLGAAGACRGVRDSGGSRHRASSLARSAALWSRGPRGWTLATARRRGARRGCRSTGGTRRPRRRRRRGAPRPRRPAVGGRSASRRRAGRRDCPQPSQRAASAPPLYPRGGGGWRRRDPVEHSTRDAATHDVVPADVVEALGRVLNSRPFRRSPRARGFLAYVVTETLSGRGERLSERTIARRALHRDADFDGRADASVARAGGPGAQAPRGLLRGRGCRRPPAHRAAPRFLRPRVRAAGIAAEASRRRRPGRRRGDADRPRATSRPPRSRGPCRSPCPAPGCAQPHPRGRTGRRDGRCRSSGEPPPA